MCEPIWRAVICGMLTYMGIVLSICGLAATGVFWLILTRWKMYRGAALLGVAVGAALGGGMGTGMGSTSTR